jgi:hypothetical protein
MKRILLIASLCVILFSCSKKNDVNVSSKAIVGKWNFVSDTVKEYTYPGNSYIETLQVGGISPGFVQYNADGTGFGYNQQDTSNFTYKISGNNLIMYAPQHVIYSGVVSAATDTLQIVSVSNTNLVLYYELITPAEGGLRYKMTFTTYYNKE